MILPKPNPQPIIKFSSYRTFLSMVVAAACIAGLSSCGPERAPQLTRTTVSASAIENSDLSRQDKAEKFAKTAELLLSADGFLQASELTAAALKHDPTNFRANFIHLAIEPIKIQRGLVIRVTPLAQKNRTLANKHKVRLADIQAQPDSAYKTFLLDGKPDIETEAQLQLLADQIAKALDNFRVFLLNMKPTEITMKANSFLIPDLIERYVATCSIKEGGPMEYELICPPSENRNEVTLNQADFMTIKAIASFYEAYASVASAYDLTGVTEASGPVLGRIGLAGVQKMSEQLLANRPGYENFGRLRYAAGLQNIRTMGIDILLGVHWVMSHQADLCPMGQENTHNRPGMFLNKGMCLGAEYGEIIEMVESAFSGPVDSKIQEQSANPFHTKLVLMAPLDHPITNLRLLGPVKFDRCGQLQQTVDKTLAGIFPHGDANLALPLMSSTCGN